MAEKREVGVSSLLRLDAPLDTTVTTPRTRERIDELAMEEATRQNQAAILSMPPSGRNSPPKPLNQQILKLERQRVRLEVARTRASGPFTGIPIGREYDSPPDDADEAAYDALEKAYNAAFWQPTPDHIERATRRFDSSSQAYSETSATQVDGPAAAILAFEQYRERIESGKSQAIGKVAWAGAKEDLSMWKDIQDSEAEGKVAKANTLHRPEDEKVPLKPDPEQHDNLEVPVDKKSMDVEADSIHNQVEQQHPNDHLALDDNESKRQVEKADKIAGEEQPTKQSEEDHLSLPSLKVEPERIEQAVQIAQKAEECPSPLAVHASPINPSTVRKERQVPEENRLLNEFLVLELQLYCCLLLSRDSSVISSVSNDFAQVTSLQMYHDHRRALVDFDADWRRRYQGYSTRWSQRGDLQAISPFPATMSTENPFRGNLYSGSESMWWTMLQNIKATINPGIGPKQTEKQRDELSATDDTKSLFHLYRRGLNGIVITPDDGYLQRQKISAYTFQIAQIQHTPGLHIVVAPASKLIQWKDIFSAHQSVQLHSYWGESVDRRNTLRFLNNKNVFKRACNATTHVLLASYEAFAEDIGTLSTFQWLLSIVDMCAISNELDTINRVWTRLLSLRCRQRLVLYEKEYHTDARRLVHCLLPEVFSSRRKILAWNCAGFDNDLIRQICSIIESFTILSDADTSQQFIDQLVSDTSKNCERELSILGTIGKLGAVKSIGSALKAKEIRVVKSSRDRIEAVQNGRAPTRPKVPTSTEMKHPSLPITSSKAAPKKRRRRDSMTRSRKRISRCGQCVGCLSDDCMVCGHCKDMKKYGGPGLRKQSCKNRKCINPRSWGISSKKKKRSNGHKPSDVPMEEADDDVGSVKEESELEGEHEDVLASYSSQDSDRDSTTENPGFIGGHSDSDIQESRLIEENLASPRDMLLSDHDDIDLSLLSASTGDSRSSRTRVMRCGKCAGCKAPDCLKCRHCLDMKKYGGPGLRKQSCKNRKCIVPKVVMLNQAKDGEYLEEKSDDMHNGGGYTEYSDSGECLEPLDSDHVTRDSIDDRFFLLSLVQDCELIVEPHLRFHCLRCPAKFSSKPLLDFHTKIYHGSGVDEKKRIIEQEACKMLLHPVYQLAIINAQLHQKRGHDGLTPMGYAKLQGHDFQYYMIQPFVILGRLNNPWRQLYKRLGMQKLHGLGGGNVDCHIGNDNMIAEEHALITWNASKESFTIECLSFLSPISVNGRQVSFSSSPVVLNSRNLVQIGSCVFYFLLPKPHGSSSSSSIGSSRTERLPRSEVRAWLYAAVRKRRASSFHQELLEKATDVAIVTKRQQRK